MEVNDMIKGEYYYLITGVASYIFCFAGVEDDTVLQTIGMNKDGSKTYFDRLCKIKNIRYVDEAIKEEIEKLHRIHNIPIERTKKKSTLFKN